MVDQGRPYAIINWSLIKIWINIILGIENMYICELYAEQLNIYSVDMVEMNIIFFTFMKKKKIKKKTKSILYF